MSGGNLGNKHLRQDSVSSSCQQRCRKSLACLNPLPPLSLPSGLLLRPPPSIVIPRRRPSHSNLRWGSPGHHTWHHASRVSLPKSSTISSPSCHPCPWRPCCGHPISFDLTLRMSYCGCDSSGTTFPTRPPYPRQLQPRPGKNSTLHITLTGSSPAIRFGSLTECMRDAWSSHGTTTEGVASKLTDCWHDMGRLILSSNGSITPRYTYISSNPKSISCSMIR